MLHLYKLVPHTNCIHVKKLKKLLHDKLINVELELCYNIDIARDKVLSAQDLKKLLSILQVFSHASKIKLHESFLDNEETYNSLLLEVGPRLNQRTPFCTNALSICKFVGLFAIKGIEISRRCLIKSEISWSTEKIAEVLGVLHDPMTECRYYSPLQSLEFHTLPDSWFTLDVMKIGSDALVNASHNLGLAFDDWDIKFYTNLFESELNRNPTSVECFDLAQSNSEHSRHWFFKGKMFIDGIEQPDCLFKMVVETLQHSNKNNKIAFCDNGSAIKGFKVLDITTEKACVASQFFLGQHFKHLTLTAETHNFPTGVAPFPGAATGTGGRQRDQHAIGRGSSIVAGTCGYCVGNLNNPDSLMPWETSSEDVYPNNLANPLKIIIDASNGASDYGNKFGEPVVAGFFRSFGMKVFNGERIEWLKPIMFSGGVGTIVDEHLHKVKLSKKTRNLLVAKIGGPAYKIGVGGGCASSLMHGENAAGRDFNAVQRGDAEMQQKLHRVVKACYEHYNNPIVSIHDQGAGGNGNVLKEIVEPSGAVIYCNAFTVGDNTLNTQELWTAEYQESDAILFEKSRLGYLKRICDRERCTLDVVGVLNGSGKVTLSEQDIKYEDGVPVADSIEEVVQNPVDLDLDLVLGKMPQKNFYLKSVKKQLSLFKTDTISFKEALDRVLSLPSVASKRFLTNKVDRSVTGLIAQQQCVGPLHTPLADVAVTALSHFSTAGSATAIGEQPIKMLVDECAGARMAVGESLTNIVFALISDMKDIKCSANWMWPAKLPGEGARLFNACKSMCKVMKELGIAVDGGKDSLSMAANVEKEIVKSPGSLVISLYAPCVDITRVLTPDLKCPDGIGWLVYVPMSKCKPCLGGSALAQCYGQLDNASPDLDDAEYFITAWKMTQLFIKESLVISGHDVSDGGFISCVLEMAFAGNCGLDLDIEFPNCSEIDFLFAENLGIILETASPDRVVEEYKNSGIEAMCIGKSMVSAVVKLQYNGKQLIDGEATSSLRDTWENTSFMLELLQCDESCVESERTWMKECKQDPCYQVSFVAIPLTVTERSVRVAVLREEGSNGDREMASALFTAGFQPWDVTMQDLIDGNVTLDGFRGLVFVGGFSYADVFGSAKGWASCCLYNAKVRSQLEAFKRREDVFSLGVCNGCQLMALLGWVGEEEMPSVGNWCDNLPPLHIGANSSERFESRFVSVKIEPSSSIMFKDMEGSVLGVWIAHGEGKFCFSDDSLQSRMLEQNLSPLRFVDHSGNVTTKYPLNPNGSPFGIAGLCSADGRHLAVMPHPERCFKMWQWPWKPCSWKNDTNSPWLRMFQNALIWCEEN